MNRVKILVILSLPMMPSSSMLVMAVMVVI